MMSDKPVSLAFLNDLEALAKAQKATTKPPEHWNSYPETLSRHTYDKKKIIELRAQQGQKTTPALNKPILKPLKTNTIKNS